MPLTLLAMSDEELLKGNKLAQKALTVSVVGYAVDGFDMLILGFLLPSIAQSLGLSAVESGMLVTWTLIGAVIGGVTFGYLSDRHGRVRVLSWSVMIFAIFTGLCAVATNFWSLLVFRTIAGLGLGGEFGIGMALVSETWPASMRARVSSYVGVGWQLGVLGAAILVPLLLPLLGWRGTFLFGMLPALFAYVIRKMMKEPVIFNSVTAPGQFSVNKFISDKENIKTTIGIAILCAVQNFGYYGLMIWLPTYLSNTLQHDQTKTIVWTVTTICGMILGIVSFGHLADMIGRKPTFIIYQVGAAISVFVYVHLSQPLTLLWGGALMGFFVNGMLGGYGALISESYPTALRATAQNTLFNLGRALGGFGPVVIGALAANYSFNNALMLLSGIYLIDIVVMLTLIPETKGRSLL